MGKASRRKRNGVANVLSKESLIEMEGIFDNMGTYMIIVPEGFKEGNCPAALIRWTNYRDVFTFYADQPDGALGKLYMLSKEEQDIAKNMSDVTALEHLLETIPAENVVKRLRTNKFVIKPRASLLINHTVDFSGKTESNTNLNLGMFNL